MLTRNLKRGSGFLCTNIVLFWCGSTQAFPFGEGGFFNTHSWVLKKTEEELPQYEFAESDQRNETVYCASPAPFGGTLPKGEGF